MPSIMYVCDQCAEHNPEACGHYEPKMLAVMPDGSWLCEDCFDESVRTVLESSPDFRQPAFADMPHPKPLAIV